MEGPLEAPIWLNPLQGLSPLSSSPAEPDAWSGVWAAQVPGSPEAAGSYGC